MSDDPNISSQLIEIAETTKQLDMPEMTAVIMKAAEVIVRQRVAISELRATIKEMIGKELVEDGPAKNRLRWKSGSGE
jgi:hypothetical protein